MPTLIYTLLAFGAWLIVMALFIGVFALITNTRAMPFQFKASALIIVALIVCAAVLWKMVGVQMPAAQITLSVSVPVIFGVGILFGRFIKL